MSMDFFARQDHARRQTIKLLVLFAVSVAVIIVAVYFVAVIAIHRDDYAHLSASNSHASYWDPELLLGVAFGTGLVIGLASLYKVAELASGGSVVAEMLGGRLVDPQTVDPAERRLLNVVEEMALASGVPVPPVYVLDNETSINAFAAGYHPNQAVVAVSRGCLDYLTRDELQGVLGHEFSHVLNGDMRLNLRLIAIVFGILLLSVIGYYVMRSAGWSDSSRRSDGRRDNSGAAIFLIGLALYILGYLGVLLGNIIKAAISRQREFLADASSVQFTRNPAALAGALKKIGGLVEGSRIRDAHAHEISHMFFGDAFAGSIFNLFATHPPLVERIRLLDPGFDGAYAVTEGQGAGSREQEAESTEQGVQNLAPRSTPPAPRPLSTDRGRILRQIGSPQPEHVEQARRVVASLPAALVDAVREPYSARAAILALVLGRDDPATRQRQWQLLQQHVDPPLLKAVEQLSAAIDPLPAESRLPVADMAVPALKRLSPKQYAAFRQMVEVLTAADGKIDLFEYCLRVVLFGCLDVQFGLRPAAKVQYKSVNGVAQPATVVLSALAYAGQSASDAIQQAFQAGTQELFPAATILPPQQCTFDSFDAALGQLAQGSPTVKRRVLDAVVATIAADGTMTIEENELLRAIAAALSCPLPPVPVA